MMKDGMNYLIEMATGFRYIVHLDKDDGENLHCSECVWVATTGCRVHQFMETGPTAESEIEKMGPCLHNKAALVSAFNWGLEIPKTQ